MSNLARELRTAERPRSARELVAAGVTPGVLRGPRWRRVMRGFYVPATTEVSPGQRIAETLRLIEGTSAVLGGWAAAYIHGAHWLDGRDRTTFELLPIDCIGPRRSSQPAVTYRHTQLATGDVCVQCAIRVTTPVRTAFDGARWSASLDDAVAFVDAMAGQARLDLDALAAYAGRHPRTIGVEQARMAARLGDPGVRSPWESVLRVCYRCDARLPAPLLNVPLFDGDRFLGQPDLFDPEAAFGVEFDGDQHRDREQHRKDNIREEKLESAGVTMTRCSKPDLLQHRPDLIARLTDGYGRGLARDRSRDRWTLVQPEWWGYR